MNMDSLIRMSDTGHHEYCATVIKVEDIQPIENSDHLATIEVNGLKTVVDKRTLHIGDIVIYISNECRITHSFLSANNLYNISNYALNANAKDVAKLLEDGKKDEAKTLCGFFEKNGRVRTIKLCGVHSFGITISPQYLIKWKPSIKNVDFSSLVGQDFDTVDDELFVKAYVPLNSIKVDRQRGNGIHVKKTNKINKVIPGKFVFHYDTQLLAKNMDLFSPNTKVSISAKMHGTSFIFANVKCNLLKNLPFYKRWWNRLIPWKFKKLRFANTYVGYSELYSSRKVLKNSYDYYGNKNGYTTDEYGYFAEKLHGKIPQDTTVYGEIVGFKPNSTTYEQKNYDYGCKPGEAKLMIYRVTFEDSKGRRQELNVDEIKAFTDSLKKRYPELDSCLIDIPILYIGKINDLLKLDVDDKWKENALAKLSSLKEFNMEKNEPLCVNKVPREGIVIRIMNDPMAEAFKLKCVKFLEREAKEIDAGNVDTEMANNEW